MSVFKRSIVTLTVCMVAGACAIGCNTFRGAGKDIRKGGEAIEDAADSAVHHDKVQQTIVASADSGGWISPSGNTNVASGANRTFTVRAYKGYRVADVVVDGSSVGAVSRYTFSSVTGGHTISASFAATPAK